MASTFTDLGIEKMATGENAGTWGDKTNTNLEIVEKAIAGYVEQAVTSGGTTALTITDGDSTESTSVARHAVIKLTGTITGNSIVTVPDSIEKVYIVTNGTSGAYTVQFKTASGTGITFGVSEKTTRLVYSDGTNLIDAGFGGSLDLEGRELVLDADGDTTITADTDDQIDIKIAGADDFQFTANTFTAQSGSSIVVPESGLTFGSTAITSTAAELNLLDGVSGLVQADFTKLAAVDSTAAELNIVDGGTSATSTTVADADRVVLNDNGTMVQVAVTDLAAYFDDEITAMPNLTSVGTLTTLTVDNVIINGSNIGHTSDTDLLTVASGIVTVAGEISVTTLDIGGTNVTSTATELNLLDGVSGLVQADLTKLAAVDSTAAELNIVDGGTSATSTTIVDADRVVLNDNGTMVQVAVTDLAAYFDDEITAMPNLTSVGTLTTLTVDNVIINGTTIGHTDDTDLITLADGVATVAGEISVTTLDIGGTNVTATAAELNFVDGGATIGTTAIADGDGIIHNDGGTMKVTSAATFKTYFTSGVSSAADDLTAGDAAVNLTTSSGNITIDAAANDSDVIFKGTDDSADITMLTLDGSDAGSATFNDKIIVGDGKLVLNSTAVTSTAAELNLLDGVSGLVQADLTKLAAVDSTAAELNIVDGGTSATSTTVADADRVVLNDNGTMVQVAMTDIKTYIGGGTSWQAVKTSNFTAAAGQGVFCNTSGGAFTLTLPAGTIGDEVSFVDYGGTFDSNNLTIATNGSEKIHGSTDNLTVATERAANTLVFTDSTQGWLLKSK
jgi:Leucine-rich repeat (LRR) protein